MRYRKVKNKITVFILYTVVFIIAASAAQFFKKISYNEDEIYNLKQPSKFLGELILPEMIEPFLGLKLMISDLIWIDLLIKNNFAQKNVEYSNYFKSSKNLQELNPYNYRAAYHNGLFLSAISKDLKGATYIFEKGCSSLKQTIYLDEGYVNKYKGVWSLFMMASYHMIFETLNFEDGKKWLKFGASLPNAPEIMSLVLEMINTSEGRNKIASAILNEMYRNATSEEERKILKDKILNIARDHELVDINQKYENFLETTGASNLSREQSYKLFMRTYHLEDSDLYGRKFYINNEGKIQAK